MMLEIISDTQVHLQDSYEQRKNMKLNETYRKKIVYSSRLTERMNILNIQYSAKLGEMTMFVNIGARLALRTATKSEYSNCRHFEKRQFSIFFVNIFIFSLLRQRTDYFLVVGSRQRTL